VGLGRAGGRTNERGAQSCHEHGDHDDPKHAGVAPLALVVGGLKSRQEQKEACGNAPPEGASQPVSRRRRRVTASPAPSGRTGDAHDEVNVIALEDGHEHKAHDRQLHGAS